MNFLVVLRIASLVLGVFSALIYLLPIIFVSRLQKTNNIFTINLCLGIVFCCSYWLAFLVMVESYPEVLFDVRICILMNYLQMLCTFQIPLALIGISTNRLFSIVYPQKAIFAKKKCMIIFVSIQWISAVVLCLPPISINAEVRNSLGSFN